MPVAFELHVVSAANALPFGSTTIPPDVLMARFDAAEGVITVSPMIFTSAVELPVTKLSGQTLVLQ
jgi:hypothetical protein